MKNLGQAIRRLRKQQGMTLAELAERKQLDSEQVALNAAFISLLEDDRQPLLEFAELLQRRSTHPIGNVSVGQDALPANKTHAGPPEEESGDS